MHNRDNQEVKVTCLRDLEEQVLWEKVIPGVFLCGNMVVAKTGVTLHTVFIILREVNVPRFALIMVFMEVRLAPVAFFKAMMTLAPISYLPIHIHFNLWMWLFLRFRFRTHI